MVFETFVIQHGKMLDFPVIIDSLKTLVIIRVRTDIS